MDIHICTGVLKLIATLISPSTQNPLPVTNNLLSDPDEIHQIINLSTVWYYAPLHASCNKVGISSQYGATVLKNEATGVVLRMQDLCRRPRPIANVDLNTGFRLQTDLSI